MGGQRHNRGTRSLGPRRETPPAIRADPDTRRRQHQLVLVKSQRCDRSGWPRRSARKGPRQTRRPAGTERRSAQSHQQPSTRKRRKSCKSHGLPSLFPRHARHGLGLTVGNARQSAQPENRLTGKGSLCQIRMMVRGGVNAGGGICPLAVALANSKRQLLKAETGVIGPTRTAAIDSAQVRSQLAAMSVWGSQVLQTCPPVAIGMAAIVAAAFALGTAAEIVSVPARKMAISKTTRLRAKLVIRM